MALSKGDLAEIKVAVTEGVWAAIHEYDRDCRRLRFWQTIAIASIVSIVGGGGVAALIPVLANMAGG